MSCASAADLVRPLVLAQRASADIDAMATSIVRGIEDPDTISITATEMIDQVNVVRETSDAAMSEMRDQTGLDASKQITALRRQLEAMTTLAEIAINLNQNPVVETVTKIASARQVVFAHYASLDLLEKFISLNPMLPSINFIQPGTEVTLPIGPRSL